MTHPDHVRLIENGIPKSRNSVWADLGSGEGAFTLALREVAGVGAEIFSIDKNKGSLLVQQEKFGQQFPETNIHFVQANFTNPLDLPLLDGIVAANSIHFEKNTLDVFRHFRSFLKEEGRIIIVEYNVDQGNMWVPYPFSFLKLKKIAQEAGFTNPKLLATIPSRFLVEIYAALLSSSAA